MASEADVLSVSRLRLLVITRPASVADFASILRINRESSPHVATLDAAELQRLIGLASVSTVSVGASGVVAYLLAMAHHASYDGEEFQRFRSQLTTSFLYVDQVAVCAEAQGQGIASTLYMHVEQWARSHGIAHLCCEVNLEPANSASLDFHHKMGFRELERLDTLDGRRVALLTKEV